MAIVLYYTHKDIDVGVGRTERKKKKRKMEKYTNYRDRGTGISPFMPIHPSKHGSIFKTVQWTIFIVKMVLLLPLIVFSVGGNFTGSMIYLLMKLVFSYSVDVTVQGKRRRAVSRKTDYPRRGNLYLCNYTSVLDALVCRIIAQDTSVLFLVAFQNEIYGMRIWSFVRYTLAQSDIAKYGEKIDAWKDVCDNYTCFMFPEGVTSNGKSVLPFEIEDARLKQFILGEDVVSAKKKRKSTTTSATAGMRDRIGGYKGNGDSSSDGKDIKNLIQWCQIKHTPSMLTVSVPMSGFEFFKTLLYVNKPYSKCKITPPDVAVGYDSGSGSSTPSITAHGRVILNGGQTPVARTLNAAQKAQFIAEWGARM